MRLVHFELILVCCLPLIGCKDNSTSIEIVNPRIEYKSNPIGIDNPTPRFSWELISKERNKSQSAYQIMVSTDSNGFEDSKAILWDSEKVTSSSTSDIVYQNSGLQSGKVYYWRVRVWDEDGKNTTWSEPQRWTMGLLNKSDWKASWIEYDYDKINSESNRVLRIPQFRKLFQTRRLISRATLYITARGIYEVLIDGERVTNDRFKPGWSDYRKRQYYDTYDVTRLLKREDHCLGIELANGWYAGRMADIGNRFYGDYPSAMAQLVLEYVDGTTDTISSDSSWKSRLGPMLSSDIIHGEKYDMRLEDGPWTASNYDDNIWLSCVTASDSQGVSLSAYPAQHVRIQDTIKPVVSYFNRDSNFLVDLGQNFAGVLHVNHQADLGDTLIINFAEMINADSTLYRANLRGAQCSDTIIADESGLIDWHPRYSYRGFRYAELISSGRIKTIPETYGLVMHSDNNWVGSFNCSSELINQLHQNITWSQKSNMFEIPTDCPQRDERLGWAADADVFLNTAAFNSDVIHFYDKWLQALADAQDDKGWLPSTAPVVRPIISSGWGDAITGVPLKLYMFYGDKTLLTKYYGNMKKWVDFLALRTFNWFNTQSTYGDWQHFNDPTSRRTNSLAYFKYSVDRFCHAAEILDKQEDLAKYRELSQHIKEVFNAYQINETGQIVDSSQTACLYALAFDLVEGETFANVQKQLIELMHQNNDKLSTGILGTSLLLDELVKMDSIQLAYKILLNKDLPSWGYQIENGATTIWEKWDGYSIQNGMNPDPNNSLNHAALGSVGQWLYTHIAGISPIKPGFAEIQIKPIIGGDLTYAEASYNSIRGMIESNWKILDDQYHIEVSIPVNTTAKVFLPANDEAQVRELNEALKVGNGIKDIDTVGNRVVITIGSGTYNFHCPYGD